MSSVVPRRGPADLLPSLGLTSPRSLQSKPLGPEGLERLGNGLNRDGERMSRENGLYRTKEALGFMVIS